MSRTRFLRRFAVLLVAQASLIAVADPRGNCRRGNAARHQVPRCQGRRVGCQEGHHHRRRHRVHARQRAAGAAVPDDASTTTTVNITYLVGSRYEGYGETGMAHLLEHMKFKGTPDAPQHPGGARRARRQRERRPPRSTARTTSRRSRPPTATSSGRSSSRPTAWSTPSSRRRISTAR